MRSDSGEKSSARRSVSASPFALILGFSTVVSAILTVSLMAVVHPLVLFTDRVNRSIHVRLAMFWMRLSFFFARVRVKVSGVDNLPPSHLGALFVANCQGPLDMFVAASIPRPIRFMIPEAALRAPLIGWIMKFAQWVGVPSADVRSQVAALSSVTKGLDRGDNVCVFPEPGPSLDGQLRKFSTAPFRTARKSGVPIVPVSIDGSATMFQSNSVVPCRRPSSPIQVTIHPPVTPAKQSDAELSKAVSTIIGSKLGSRPDVKKDLTDVASS